MNRVRPILVLLMAVALAACSAGPNPMAGSAADGEVIAG